MAGSESNRQALVDGDLHAPCEPESAWRTVVGVVSDVRYHAIGEVQLDIYDPALQVGLGADNIVVRTSGDPRSVAERASARSRASSTRPSIVDDVTTMDAVVGRAEAPWRLTMWMFVLFASLAFGLAALGLFSLVALEVAHRRREFAIRLALGASGAMILQGVMRRAGGRVAGGPGAWFWRRVRRQPGDAQPPFRRGRRMTPRRMGSSWRSCWLWWRSPRICRPGARYRRIPMRSCDRDDPSPLS